MSSSLVRGDRGRRRAVMPRLNFKTSRTAARPPHATCRSP